MKLSTRGRYGLKAMFQLGLYFGKGPIPLKQIADEQKLSESYLEQLFAALRKAELINSVRGAQGGYMLSREPKNITVGQVLRCLEGDLGPSDCVMEIDGVKCSQGDECVTKLVWLKIKDSVDDVIDSITLQDMLDDEYKLKTI